METPIATNSLVMGSLVADAASEVNLVRERTLTSLKGGVRDEG